MTAAKAMDIKSRKVIYTDNSLEFVKSCEALSWNHMSSPHRSATIGAAERAVRRVEEGTYAVLMQPGLDEKWWADSMECYCYLRSIQDLWSDGETHYERRLGVPFDGPMVEYQPISAKDQSRIHQFERKYYLYRSLDTPCTQYESGKGDLLVADIDELQQMDASEIYVKRLTAKEVLTPSRGEKFKFPIADGTEKLSGGNQVQRTSTLIRNNPDRGEGPDILRGSS